ncbi:MAG: NERD domain-containing protein [Candidatus Gracilibacteria bacterium]
MLEIRRGIAVRHYENSFFRSFAKNLQNMFDKYNLDGLLIANSECIVDERLQIDTLLITQNAVCIIDFKNFNGKIILPHADDFYNGIWTNEDGKRIKGGSSINPYKQLNIQKKKFLSNSRKNITGIYENNIENNIAKNDCFNPRHILKIICFQHEIHLQGNIPLRDEIDFFITDKDNYLEQIKDIMDIKDDEVKISQNSFIAFKKIFKANKFDLEEQYEKKAQIHELIDINKKLYQDQEFALNDINNFLMSEDDKIFILNGSSNSGKSYLITFIEELAFKNKFQETKKLVQSKRIANNLSSQDIKFDSIYSYIYGGETLVQNKDNEETKIVPLKTNDDEQKCLYIIDEAQLISDSYYKSIDLQFGSGHLLKDLIQYININDSQRKIIFIGDPYQLTIGSKEETSINNSHIETQYKLKSKSFSLLDKELFSNITKESLKCVRSIKKEKYNLLDLSFSDSLQKVEKDNLKNYILHHLNNDFKILVYSNSDAKKVNIWIKESILKNGKDIAINDLILFHNNISIENNNDPFAQPQKIFNGEFAYISGVSSTSIEKSILLNNKKITLKFREIQVKLKTNEVTRILSLENFRLNQKNELLDDEIIAYQILLSNIIKEESTIEFEKSFLLNNQDEKDFFIKLKQDGRIKANTDREKEIKKEFQKFKNQIQNKLDNDTSSWYYKYKNVAWIKFGWAITIHKSISYKFDEVLINTDQGDNRGKTNDNYFRWIYSGLTRAVKKVTLINYVPITPFSKIYINYSQSTHKDFYYISTNEQTDNFQNLKDKYNFPEDKSFLINFYQFILSRLQDKINILDIEHKDWQEIYTFSLNDKLSTVRFYYNRKFQFKAPQVISSSNKEFENIILKLLKENTKLNNFDFLNSTMKDTYIKLNDKLYENSMSFSYIIQKPYKDEIKFLYNNESLLAELNYNGDGFFTKINIFSDENNILSKLLVNSLESL